MRLAWHLYDRMVRAALRAARNNAEACGYLSIHSENETHAYMWELPNIAPDPGHRFMFDDDLWMEHCQDLDESGMRPVAIWHSHPGYPPEPSEHDIRYAVDPNLLHLIISVPVPGRRFAEGVPHAKLWRINPDAPDGERVKPETLAVW